MTIEAHGIRSESLKRAKALGYPTNDQLPLLGERVQLRTVGELSARMLCMNAAVAVACGYPRAKAIEWLKQEKLQTQLSRSEEAFLADDGSEVEMRHRVEALWALAWCAGFVEKLNFAKPCSDELVTFFPSLKENETSASFRSRIVLRSHDEILAQCDLAYCLHWAIQDAMLLRKRPPGRLHPIYVIERRHALEWMLTATDWDDVAMDT